MDHFPATPLFDEIEEFNALIPHEQVTSTTNEIELKANSFNCDLNQILIEQGIVEDIPEAKPAPAMDTNSMIFSEVDLQNVPIEFYDSLDSIFKINPEIKAEAPTSVKVQEIAPKPTEPQNVHTYSKNLHKIQNGRVSKRQIKKRDESSGDESDAESTVTKAKTNRKLKLYEQGKFDDPVMEQKRQNAINAKKNRDRKRNENKFLTTTMNKLREENKAWKKKAKKYKTKMEAFERRLEVLEAVISSHGLKAAIKSSGKTMSSSSSSSEDDEPPTFYNDSD